MEHLIYHVIRKPFAKVIDRRQAQWGESIYICTVLIGIMHIMRLELSARCAAINNQLNDSSSSIIVSARFKRLYWIVARTMPFDFAKYMLFHLTLPSHGANRSCEEMVRQLLKCMLFHSYCHHLEPYLKWAIEIIEQHLRLSSHRSTGMLSESSCHGTQYMTEAIVKSYRWAVCLLPILVRATNVSWSAALRSRKLSNIY